MLRVCCVVGSRTKGFRVLGLGGFSASGPGGRGGAGPKKFERLSSLILRGFQGLGSRDLVFGGFM